MEWLGNSKTPSRAKLDQLYSTDSEGSCALHHAARHYKADLLNAALDIEEGIYMYMYHSATLY